MIEHAGHGVSERVGVIGGHDEPGLPVADQIAQLADVADDRHAAGPHRLTQGDRKAFVSAGEHEDAGLGHVRSDGIDLPGHFEARLQPGVTGRPGQFRLQRPVADEHGPQTGPLARQPGNDLNKGLRTFHVRQPAHPQQIRRAPVEWKRRSLRRPDASRDHAHRRAHALVIQKPLGPAAADDDGVEPLGQPQGQPLDAGRRATDGAHHAVLGQQSAVGDFDRAGGHLIDRRGTAHPGGDQGRDRTGKQVVAHDGIGPAAQGLPDQRQQLGDVPAADPPQ